MKKIVLKYSVLCLLALVFAVTISTSHGKTANAAYLQNELIDNSVFLNSSSMSVAQIQSFLAGKGSYLTSYSLNETDPAYANYNHIVLASQIIYDTAQTYGINPQVILSTLQKEESLVTDPTPNNSQLDFAMGYGCADATGCEGYSGFFNQVDNATWQLRFNFERARGNATWWNSTTSYSCRNSSHYYAPGLIPGNTVTFYDDYGTGYASFPITNAATASLYCYTPHAYPGSAKQYFSGSYNFVTSFNQWFGSTLSSFALVKSSASPTIYLLDGPTGIIYPIPSYDVMSELNLLSLPVAILAPSAIQGFSQGGTLTTLIRQQSGEIDLIDSGRIYSVSSADVCTAWGLACFDASKVQTLSPTFINSLAKASSLPALQENNGTVYYMQAGLKEPVVSSQEITNLGFAWKDVAHMDNVNSTQSLGAIQIPNGTSIKFKSSNAIYLYDNNSYQLIQDPNILAAWGLGNNLLANPATSSYDTTAPATTGTISSLFATDGTKTYLINQGTKIDITSSLANWPTVTPVSTAQSTLSSLPTVSSTLLIRSTSGGIYTIKGGVKRPVPNMTDFYALGYTPSQITNVSDYTASIIPTGGPILADGSLFRVSNSAAIYIINNGSSYLIPTPNYFGDFNLQPSQITNLDSSVLTAYPVAGNFSVYVQNGGQKYIASNNNLYPISTATIASWGIGSAVPTTLSNSIFITMTNSGSIGNFVRTPDGAIYYGNAGQSHKINSYASFVSLGGTAKNTINVDSEFILLSPTGVAIN